MGKCLAQICDVPFRKIVSREYNAGVTLGVLSCGHKVREGLGESWATRRRCYVCANNGHVTHSYRTMTKGKCQCEGCKHAKETLKLAGKD